MKSKGFYLILSALILSLAAGCGGTGSGGGGGGGAGSISGIVNTVNYSPISNASVISGSNSTTTLNTGQYILANIITGINKIKISHPSYTPAYRQLTMSDGQSLTADIAFLSDIDSKITPISATGGTARNTNSLIKMVFPSGAFSTTTDVVLTSVPMIASPYNAPAGNQFVSYVVYVKPDTITLGAPARLSVPNITGTTQEAKFYHFNTDTYAWDFIANGTPSSETHTIDVNVSVMGWIAAIMPITPVPGSIKGTVKNSSTSLPIANANIWTNTSYAVSDSSGNYTLNYVPVGTAEVRASALNYLPYGPYVVGPVSSETEYTYPISMTAVPNGTITGTVRKLNTLLGVPDARVTESHKGGVTYTNSMGQYTLYNVEFGATNVSAYASGYISSSESITVAAGETATVNFYLPYTGIVSGTSEFTFDGGSFEGFTKNDSRNLWHVQYAPSTGTNIINYYNSSHGIVTRKVTLPDSPGYLPPKRDGSSNDYYLWYGQYAGSNLITGEGSYIGSQEYGDILTTEAYTGGISYLFSDAFGLNMGSIESPSIDLKGFMNCVLSFWTWWEVEGVNPSTGYDTMGLYISTNGGSSWTTLGYLNPFSDPQQPEASSEEAYTSGGYNSPGVWVKHNINLTPYIGQIIKLRFEFNTVDFLHNGYRGWIIDDIKLENKEFGMSGIMPVNYFSDLRKSIPVMPRKRH